MTRPSQSEDELFRLFAKRPQTIKPGLKRMQSAWDALRLNEGLPPCVLIGGTNGKGSTSGMLWHLFAALGLPVGLFTSPHLCQFSERIQCSHSKLTDAALIQELAELRRQLNPEIYAELSFFEVTTLIAFSVFKKKQCELIVLEVGLGGRWDSTNIVEPLASAIVSVDKDHEAWLGHHIAEIAQEKLGISRRARPLFWGERFTDEKAQLRETLTSQQQSVGFELLEQGKHFAFNPDNQHIELSLPALPAWQGALPAWVCDAPSFIQHNFAISLALFYWLSHCPALASSIAPAELCRKALANFAKPEIPWPPSLIGRFQSLEIRQAKAEGPAPKLILDVCHNQASVKEFIDSLRKSGILGALNEPIPGVVSILSDKDVNGILDLLREVCHPLILFQVTNTRSIRRENLAPRHADLMLFEDFSKAWEYAYKNWSRLDKTWAVCGSFLAVGEVIRYFSAYPKHRQLSRTLIGSPPSCHSSP